MKLNRSVMLAVCGLVLLWGMGPMAGAGFAGTNFAGNPNQIRWKFSEEMDVPHIAWAKPLAGGPVRATVIAPVLFWNNGGGFAYRDVAELCQRLSLHINPVMTKDFATIPDADAHDGAYPDLGDTPDVWMALVAQRLGKPADVVVIGKMQWSAFAGKQAAGGWEKGTKWDAFSFDLRSTIVNQVKGGCGLFYISPVLERAAGGNVSLSLPTGDAAEKVALKKLDGSDDLLRGLTGLRLPALGQQDWTNRVYSGSLGKGRVLVVEFPGDRSSEHCLAPSSPGGSDLLCAYEYLMSFTARGILWCAGREPPAKIRNIEVDAARGIEVTVTDRPADAQLSVELRDVSGEIGRVVQAWNVVKASLPLPRLDSGTYFVNAWLRNGKGEVLDWGSARLDVAAAVPAQKLIQGIETREAAFRAGQPVAGNVLVKGAWPAGDMLRLSALDTFGRCLWRQEWKTASERTPFSVELEPGRAVAVILRAERASGGEATEVCEKTLCLSTKGFDGDFASVIWSGFGTDERFNRQDLGLLRRIGIDSVYLVGPNFREACARANMRTLWNLDRVTSHPASAQGFCSPKIRERWRTMFRDGAASSKAQAPLALTFGDEAQYGDFMSQLTPPYSDQDFRIFLGEWFGKSGGKLDLDALNKAWGTVYQSEDEIKVRSFADLRKANEMPQAVCEVLWTEWQYHRLLVESASAAQSEAPQVYYGDEGVGGMQIHEGHDYYLLGRDMTLFQLYDTEGGPFLIKSFARPDSLRGMWTGNYSYYIGAVDEEWMRSFPWRSLFYGMNSVWWWEQGMSIHADGRPIPCLEQYGEEVRRIKAGPATLMLKVAKPSQPQVGVLYSPNTIAVHTFDHDEAGPHPRALATVCEGLIRAGYAFRLLHPTQLDDSTELSSGYRALVLPAILAVSAKQAATIRRFVEQGGLLLADQAPERYCNELGMPYEKDPFRSVFSKGADATEFTHGRGKALFLKESFSLSHLLRYKDVMGQTFSEKSGKPLARLFRDWIEPATGCKPPASVTLADGSPLMDGEISPFTEGAALYLGIDRNGRYWEGEQCRWLTWKGYQEEVEATLTFPKAAHIYDVTRGEYVGQGPAVKVKLTSYPRLFAALPAKIDKVELAGLKEQYRPGETICLGAKVGAVPAPAYSHVLHVSVKNANGETLPCFERNVIAAGGAGKIDLALALDEQPGEYRLVVRDVASGIRTESKFQIVK